MTFIHIRTWIRAICLVVVGASATLATYAGDISFTKYHTQAEINQFMRAEAQKYPGLVQFKVLGQSEQGREISYVIVGKIPSAPALYYNGTHHGDEWSSTEGIIGLIDFLVTHQNDPDVATLLSSYTFYLQPLVNPDGHAAQTRTEPHGRDPNRDYAYAGRSEADSFKIPVIALVKQLMDGIKPHGAAAYHSGIEEVLWSWCYTDAPTADGPALLQITKRTASAMGFDRYMQSYFDYATDGEFIDFAYMKYHTIALTFEVSNDKTPDPSELAAVVSRSVQGAIAFAQAIHDYDRGTLSVSHSAYEAARKSWKASGAPIRLE